MNVIAFEYPNDNSINLDTLKKHYDNVNQFKESIIEIADIHEFDLKNIRQMRTFNSILKLLKNINWESEAY